MTTLVTEGLAVRGRRGFLLGARVGGSGTRRGSWSLMGGRRVSFEGARTGRFDNLHSCTGLFGWELLRSDHRYLLVLISYRIWLRGYKILDIAPLLFQVIQVDYRGSINT